MHYAKFPLQDYLVFFFRTGLQATHGVLGSYQVPTGTMLVTPDLEQ